MNGIGGAFASEWLKLRRRGLLLGGVLPLLAFTILVTVLTIERATKTLELGRRGFRVSVDQLSQPDGLVHGLTSASTLLGIIVLGIFAMAMGSEYGYGTLRNLLVREPRRLRLLAGKYLALLVFGAVLVTVACAVSVAVSFALGPSKGVDTSAWTSSAGLHALVERHRPRRARRPRLRHPRRGARHRPALVGGRLGRRRRLAAARRGDPELCVGGRGPVAAGTSAGRPVPGWW